MRNSHTQHQFPALNGASAYSGGIEWEELPSLVDTLAQRLIDDVKRRQPLAQRISAWDNTMPANLDLLVPGQPFLETLHGLVQREVHEPDVFRHFFGTTANP